MSTPEPRPRPGPAGPDTDELRVAFDDLLEKSATVQDFGADESADGVHDAQVAALDAAHELLAGALAALDSQR